MFQAFLDFLTDSQGVQEGLKAGIIVLLLDVLLVVVAIGLLLKYFENWKWRHTRRQLASNLLGSAHHVVCATQLLFALRCIDEEEELLFNDAFLEQLEQIEKAIKSIDDQIVIHANSLNPKSTEELAFLSYEVAGFRHTITLLRFEYERLCSALPKFDHGARFGIDRISCELLSLDGDGLTKLMRSDPDLFYRAYFAKFCEFTFQHCSKIVDLVAAHVGSGKQFGKLPKNWDATARERKDQLLERRARIREMHEVLKTKGVIFASAAEPKWAE